MQLSLFTEQVFNLGHITNPRIAHKHIRALRDTHPFEDFELTAEYEVPVEYDQTRNLIRTTWHISPRLGDYVSTKTIRRLPKFLPTL